MNTFGQFSPKDLFWPNWPPLKTFLTKFMSINLTEIIFRKIYGKNYLTPFPILWSMASFWPQNDPILTNFTKNDLFWPNLKPLMTFLTRFLSTKLTEIIFRNFYRKNYLTTSPNFDIWGHLGPKNVWILDIFNKNDLFWKNWPH